MSKRDKWIIIAMAVGNLLALLLVTHYAQQIDAWGMR